MDNIVFPNPCLYVKESSKKIVSKMKNIKINEEGIKSFVNDLCKNNDVLPRTKWSESHFPAESVDLETLIKYIMIIDTLNFCFWPNKPFEYENLAKNLYDTLIKNKNIFKIESLMKITKEELKENIFKCDFCLLEERVRMLREVFTIIHLLYEDSCKKFVEKSNKNASKLVKQILDNFVCFRDTSIYDGEQCFFYKRAQIMVSDLYLAYLDLPNKNNENEILNFGESISELTMFADYRVPQILRSKNILIYNNTLSEAIDNNEIMLNGSIFEVEIRASTIISVEKIKEELKKNGKIFNSIDIDVHLWEEGEKIKEKIKPNHKTLSIFY